MTMHIRVISGLGGKEPACFLIEAGGKRLLLDLGEGPDHGRRPDVNGLGSIDGVLISHIHPDHCGALDWLEKIGNPPLFATDITARLLRRSMHRLPLHGEADILGLRIRTGRSGHAPGGIWIRIDAGGGLLYMGDHSSESPLYAFDPPPPSRIAILDASYGDYDLPASQAQTTLAKLARSDNIFLPSPPAGRGLEMALILGQTSSVALCPAHQAMRELLLHEASASLKPGLKEKLHKLKFRQLSLADPLFGSMIAANADASSGMAGSLLAQALAEKIPVVFTGHIGAETTAEKLLQSRQADFMRWNVHPRLSELQTLVGEITPEIVIPAFGLASHLPIWQQAFHPAQVLLEREILL